MTGRPFVRFLGVGVINTLVGYGLFAALLALTGRPIVAVIAATTLGALFNFLSIGRLVFRNADPMLLPRFLGVYAVQCAANSGALTLLGQAGIGPYLAQFLLLPPLAIGTYLAMRRYVFRAATTAQQR